MSNPFKVGDILYSSWGYDQTNIDFYEVVRTTEKSVWILRIGAQRDERQRLTPVPGSYVKDFKNPDGKPKRKVPFSYSGSGGSWEGVRLTSYSSAYRWDGKPKSDTYTYGGAGH